MGRKIFLSHKQAEMVRNKGGEMRNEREEGRESKLLNSIPLSNNGIDERKKNNEIP